MFIRSLLLWRDLSSVLINVDGESDSIIVNSALTVTLFAVSVSNACGAFSLKLARQRGCLMLFHLTAAVPAFARVAAGGALASAQMARSGRPVGTRDGWMEGRSRRSRAPDTVNAHRHLALLHRRAGASTSDSRRICPLERKQLFRFPFLLLPRVEEKVSLLRAIGFRPRRACSRRCCDACS